MPMNKDQPRVLLEDTMLVAFLKLKGITATPWVCTDDDDVNKGRVQFEMSGEPGEVEKQMQAYYGNEKVGIQDYVRCLKETKSEMYNIKKITR